MGESCESHETRSAPDESRRKFREFRLEWDSIDAFAGEIVCFCKIVSMAYVMNFTKTNNFPGKCVYRIPFLDVFSPGWVFTRTSWTSFHLDEFLPEWVFTRTSFCPDKFSPWWVFARTSWTSFRPDKLDKFSARTSFRPSFAAFATFE